MATKDEGAYWSIFGYLLSGLLIWGGVGKLLDNWAGHGGGGVGVAAHAVISPGRQGVDQISAIRNTLFRIVITQFILGSPIFTVNQYFNISNEFDNILEYGYHQLHERSTRPSP